MTDWNCSAVKLTSKEGRPYWLRTCDIGGDIWAQGAHPVSFPKGARCALSGRGEPFTFRRAVLGMSYNAADTWLLDGVNDAGLTGGLLALYDSTSVSQAGAGYEGVMGMELLTYLLGRCASVDEVARAARSVQVLDVPMGEGRTAVSFMHCMFVDLSGRCVILEAADPARPGLFTIYRENLGLMTNSPPYPAQLDNLRWFLSQSPELNWGRKTPSCLTLNGMTVAADPGVPHLSRTGTFPASYAAYDRFIRLAVLTALNNEGREIPDRQMLPQGELLMSPLIEPHNRGVFHYTYFSEATGPVGGHESFTQYLTVYDLTGRKFCLKPWDSTAWTALALADCPTDRVQRYPVCRAPLGGVVRG